MPEVTKETPIYVAKYTFLRQKWPQFDDAVIMEEYL